MIGRLAELAALLERAFDAVRPRRVFGPAEIDPYSGYATSENIVLRGRVLSRKPIRAAKALNDDSSAWTNFKAMIALFRTREQSGIDIRCEGLTTLSDEEGYFDITLPRPSNATGWQSYACQFGVENEAATLTALLPSSDASYGIISDIDDTLIKTEAWSLARNLWNSLTGNAESRFVFPDAVDLIKKLHNSVNPVFYVSSSPWNMHAFLTEVFARAGLVQGPKFLRDLGISKTKIVKEAHGTHKARSIDTILAANPDLQFILIGDTGQHDARVYYHTTQRHPDRIRQIILRTPKASIDRKDKLWIDKIMGTGTPIYVGETYDSLLP